MICLPKKLFGKNRRTVSRMKKARALLYTRIEVVFIFWMPLHKGDIKGMRSEDTENTEGTQTTCNIMAEKN